MKLKPSTLLIVGGAAAAGWFLWRRMGSSSSSSSAATGGGTTTGTPKGGVFGASNAPATSGSGSGFLSNLLGATRAAPRTA